MSNIDAYQKEIDKYLDSIYTISHSRQSVNAYQGGLKQFFEMLNVNYNCDVSEFVSKIKNEELDVFKILQEFVIFLDKQNKKPATIKLWLTAVKGILRHFDIKIYSEDFRQFVKIPKDIKRREEPLTKEILVRLLRNVPPKLQTTILVAIASGMRIGEIVQIRLSNIDFESNPVKIRIRAETTKTREARETYLTAEATKALKDYLIRFFGWQEGRSNDSIQERCIFGRTAISRTSLKNDNGFGIIRKTDEELTLPTEIVAKNVMITSLKVHLKKVPELAKVNEDGRMIIHFHGFRKFFYTQLSNVVGSNYAHALMGHHEYLDTYYNLPENEKRELYLKAEPYLTISDYSKIEKELFSVRQRQKEIEESHLELLKLLKDGQLTIPKQLEKYIRSEEKI